MTRGRIVDRVVATLLGLAFLVYAYAKFSGNQFSHFELYDRVADVHPITLVWYFFGYSRHPYAMFIACGELVAGLLRADPADGADRSSALRRDRRERHGDRLVVRPAAAGDVARDVVADRRAVADVPRAPRVRALSPRLVINCNRSASGCSGLPPRVPSSSTVLS